MYEWTDLPDSLRTAIGPGAVCEKGNAELAFGIDPKRCSGVAEVAERAWGEIASRRRGRRRGIPSERARSSRGRGFAQSEERDSLRFENGRAATEHAFGKASDIGCRCKQPRMSCNSAHNGGVLVVDFALDDPKAEGSVVFAGRDSNCQVQRRGEKRLLKVQGFGNFAVEE